MILAEIEDDIESLNSYSVLGGEGEADDLVQNGMLIVKDKLKNMLRPTANDVIHEPETLLLVSVARVWLEKHT